MSSFDRKGYFPELDGGGTTSGMTPEELRRRELYLIELNQQRYAQLEQDRARRQAERGTSRDATFDRLRDETRYDPMDAPNALMNLPAAALEAVANLTNLRRGRQEGFGANVRGALDVGRRWMDDPNSVNYETYAQEVNFPYPQAFGVGASLVEPGVGPRELQAARDFLPDIGSIFLGGRTLRGVTGGPVPEGGLPGSARVANPRITQDVVPGEPMHTFRTNEDEVDFRGRQADQKPGARIFSEPVPVAREIAERYKRQFGGLDYDPERYNQGIITALDADHQKLIADAFDAAPNAPFDPEVRAAYEALAEETLDQFQAILDSGIQFEIYTGKGEPYSSSAAMLKDVRENGHMYILSTEKDFGETGISDQVRAENPLLGPSQFTDVNGVPMLINDIFRGVHDFFGHSVRGNSFGAVGEENAWMEHALMYSPLARRAMTTETRGQNSWVNFGPRMRNPDGTIKRPGDPGYKDAKQRGFADQKMTLLPEWASNVLLGEELEGLIGR